MTPTEAENMQNWISFMTPYEFSEWIEELKNEAFDEGFNKGYEHAAEYD